MLRSATSPSRLMPFRPRARLQLRHLVGIDTNMIMPAVRRTLDHAGLQCVKIVPETDADFPCQPIGPEQRTGALCGRFNTAHDGGDAGDPAEPWRVASEHHLHWHPGPADDLGACLYPGCGQHGAVEHMPIKFVRQGLAIMAGIFWDLGHRT